MVYRYQARFVVVVAMTLAMTGLTTAAHAQTYRCVYESYQDLMKTNLLNDGGWLERFWGRPDARRAREYHEQQNARWKGRVLFITVHPDRKSAQISGDWFGNGTAEFEVRQVGGGQNSWTIQRQYRGAASAPIHTIRIRDWGENTPKDASGHTTYRFIYLLDDEALAGSCQSN